MATLLVTVVHGRRRRDLAVRADVPIAELVGPLAEALADDPPEPHPLAHPPEPPHPTHPAVTAPAIHPTWTVPGTLPGGTSRATLPGGTVAATHPGVTGGGAVGLAPVCGRALPVERSLAACGVGHGAVLVLIGGGPGGTPPRPAGARPPVAG